MTALYWTTRLGYPGLVVRLLWLLLLFGSTPTWAQVPTLTAVSPLLGVPGSVLTLTGTNLTGTTSIVFAGGAGNKIVTGGFVVEAAGTRITGVVVPAGAQSGPVVVTTPSGTSAVGPALFSRATVVACGNYHTLSVRADGTLWAWGRNDDGQLGIGSNTNSPVPQQVGTATNWASVAGGYFHSAAVRQDGTLWTWGRNDYGALGDGTTTNSTVPVQVGTATNWVSVSAGLYYTMAVRADGTLWGFGYNGFGQLGQGTATNSLVPVQVGTASNWVSVSGTNSHTLAVRADGTLWAWGRNFYGQLGNGTDFTTGYDYSFSTVPMQVGTATTWVSASASEGAHSLAVRSDGTLWSWGYNNFGQLGDGTTTNRNLPQQVGTATTWASVSGGYYHTLALQGDGTRWGFGYNGSGVLGRGANVYASSNVPVQTDVATWVSVSAGQSHSVGEQSCRAVWAWGDNSFGQVGDNSGSGSHYAPVLIFNPVSLLSFTPGGAAAGTSVAVTGTGLAGLTALTVNGVSALASVVGSTDTGFTFLVPAGTTVGAGTVTVTTSCGPGSSMAFTVLAPPLPVTLVRFEAVRQVNGEVSLTWTTASELNSLRFEVERSADGQQFTALGQVAAAGSSIHAQVYAYHDGQPLAVLIAYYRLRLVDQDGTATYSSVRAVTSTGPEATLRGYPSPARGILYVSSATSGAIVVLLDGLGRQVATGTTGTDGVGQLVLPVGLAAGLYVLRDGTAMYRVAVE